MRTTLVRGGAAAASTVVSVMLITGCTTTGTPVAVDGAGATSTGASSTATPTGDVAKVKSLALTAADLPPGFTFTPLPEDQFRKAVTQSGSFLRDATITPPACANLQKLPDVDPAQLGGAVATAPGGDGLVEGLAARPADIAAARTAATGPCKNFTIRLNSGPTAGSATAATSTLLPAPATRADPQDVLMLRQDLKVSTDGQTVDVVSYSGVASVKGYNVSVVAGPGRPGATPDDAAFRQFFTAAVNKVAAQG
ncbi:DUF5642 family protein [Gordonia sp. DT30]|uniref:DUF5642 family protein n=1 Tax=Gordonia sp. DT30 TaxID=3416546 RepID=UPI003CFAAC30